MNQLPVVSNRGDCTRATLWSKVSPQGLVCFTARPQLESFTANRSCMRRERSRSADRRRQGLNRAGTVFQKISSENRSGVSHRRRLKSACCEVLEWLLRSLNHIWWAQGELPDPLQERHQQLTWTLNIVRADRWLPGRGEALLENIDAEAESICKHTCTIGGGTASGEHS